MAGSIPAVDDGFYRARQLLNVPISGREMYNFC